MSNEGQGDEPSHDGGGAQGAGQGGGKDGHGFLIRIDRQEFRVQEEVKTGAQLRTLPDPDIGPDRDLFEVVPGGSDLKIELADKVKMRNGLRFFTAPAQINPGRE